MLLTIGERYALLGILPTEGNMLALVTVRKLQDILVPTGAERKEFGVIENKETGRVAWAPEKATEEVDIKISDEAKTLVVTTLKKLEDNKALTLATMSLYEKFVMKG
jgi:hypothetical protein